jgi:hypothetical protein
MSSGGEKQEICISLECWCLNLLKGGDLLDQGENGSTILKLTLKEIYEEVWRIEVTRGCVGISVVDPSEYSATVLGPSFRF